MSTALGKLTYRECLDMLKSAHFGLLACSNENSPTSFLFISRLRRASLLGSFNAQSRLDETEPQSLPSSGRLAIETMPATRRA